MGFLKARTSLECINEARGRESPQKMPSKHHREEISVIRCGCRQTLGRPCVQFWTDGTCLGVV